MGVFDDKKFEQLDWMTQITETIESELNGLLARLPDRIEFDIASLARWMGGSLRPSLSVDSVVRGAIEKVPHQYLSYDEQNKLIGCFRFEMSPTLELDLSLSRMTGSLALVKITPTLSDEELQPLMGARGIDHISSEVRFEEKWPTDRLNEILDILSKCEEAQRSRSHNKKMHRIKERLKEIFKTNEWRIRDMELANRVCVWVADYIQTGNLAALTNICKLKVMTHNNMPIYSVEEEK
jgi:hypothetical protein